MSHAAALKAPNSAGSNCTHPIFTVPFAGGKDGVEEGFIVVLWGPLWSIVEYFGIKVANLNYQPFFIKAVVLFGDSGVRGGKFWHLVFGILHFLHSPIQSSIWLLIYDNGTMSLSCKIAADGIHSTLLLEFTVPYWWMPWWNSQCPVGSSGSGGGWWIGEEEGMGGR